ncbi:MAG: hypothetical protein JNK82_12880 [Myxococcaceae bacterium]|nr:hypothetical protein [Myxococcaceae bacterium]
MTRLLPCLALVLALFVTGCPKTQMPGGDGGMRPADCTSRAECSEGKVCVEGGYCDQCSSSGQCRVTEVCDETSKLCRFRDGWGTLCSNNDQCQAGSWCKQGLCKDRSEVNLCPGGMSSECPQGNRCNTLNTVCEEDLGCSDRADCSPMEICNVGSHQCVPRCTTETQATVCAGGERCVMERCVQCTTNADCGAGLQCDTAGRCAACVPGADPNCCYSDRDCTIPNICIVQIRACRPRPPPCASNDNCPANQRCDVGSGRCVPATCQPDTYEPNNLTSMAFAVTNGSYRNLTLCMGDVDYFGLNLNRGDQLGVNIDADPFSESTFSTVVKDGTGRTLSSGKLLVSYVATSAQQYFVGISTTDPYQLYDVTFLLSRGTPCDDDALEPNDFENQPTIVNSASQLEGAICPQDVDWFTFNVPAAKGAKVSLVNYDASRGLLRLCLFDSDGMTQLGCSEDPLPTVTATAAQVGGRMGVRARVLGSTDRVANGYTLKVEFP